MNPPMLFNDWSGIGRTLFVGFAAYVVLIAMLRVSGKRTLSKMNAFDLVVTVALGSTLATVLLNQSIPLAEGVAALALLIFLQYAITWSSVRSPRFQAMIKAEPTLLVHDGRYLDDALRRQRVTQDEIGAAIRANGQADLSNVAQVVLETDGSMSVIPR
ncbi:MAG: DUF421 domain-containing protein [Paracoccus sp. (in: a-proteobacteria)]|uniref:DUF421 domain-containing protein n=1 Tax=Paracoccus sp. TaxID=267 RepID=UPI002E83BEE1|nr:YetF domain-containing protein [Pseudomonadota bacterium]